jgi:hypothetical protein
MAHAEQSKKSSRTLKMRKTIFDERKLFFFRLIYFSSKSQLKQVPSVKIKFLVAMWNNLFLHEKIKIHHTQPTNM